MAKKSVATTVERPTRQFALITINGTEYKLAYDFNAICKANDITGLNLMQALGSLSDLNPSQLRGLFFASLLVAYPDITLEETGWLMGLTDIVPIQFAIGEAYSKSMPVQKKSEGVEEPNETPEPS